MNKEVKNQAKHPNLKARVMPHNTEAEQAVLGCILIDEDAPIHILPQLIIEDFYSNAHKDIYTAMTNISAHDKPIDIVTLVQELETMGSMESVGGLSYITMLTNIVPSASNHKHYSEIVKKNSLLRKLIKSGQKIIDSAYTGDANDDALQMAEREIYSLSEQLDKSSLVEVQPSIQAAIDKMEQLYKDPKASRGIPTGFSGLNKLINGLQPSDLILIAARPGQGKTSIGMNFIQFAALSEARKTDAGKPDPYKCAVFSLEMPAIQLAKRLICSVAKVSMANANSGQLSPEEWKKLFHAKALLADAKIYIDDSSLTTPIEILSKCRRLKREQGLDLIMVDYLQLMSSGKRVESRQQEISEITRTMKIAAKELNVPILLLSQMSRDIEKRTNKTPQMSDLRESGAIEQDADIIMFIYREHEANDTTVDANVRNQVKLIIAKHRNGSTGEVELKWRGETVSFEDGDKSSDGNSLEDTVPPPKKGSGFVTMGDVVEDKSTEEIMSASTDDIDSIF